MSDMHKYFDIFSKGFLSLFLDEVAEFESYSLCFSRMDSIYWNAAYNIDMMESEVSESVVDIELLFFPKKLVPTFWVTKEDRPDDFEFIIQDKGYTQRAIDNWMMHANPAEVAASEKNVHIERVQSEGQLEDFITVFSNVFSDTEGKSAEMLRRKGVDSRYMDKSFLYIGYDDNKPVSMSGFVLSDNTAILHSVGSIENHRQKGYANTMARHAIREANNLGTISQVMLQVDENNAEAVHLFQTLGFSDLMQVKIYAKQ